jgi:hypothetical protein
MSREWRLAPRVRHRDFILIESSQANSNANALRITGRTNTTRLIITAEARAPAGQYHNFHPI